MVVWARTFRKKHGTTMVSISDSAISDEIEDTDPYADNADVDHWAREDEEAE